MSKSVVISLGHGNLNQGFPRVTVQVWETNNPHREQFIGSLPPAPQLDQLYKNWKIIYQSLCDRKLLRTPDSDDLDDHLEIGDGITNVSQHNFSDLCDRLEAGMDTWLKSEGILGLSRKLRSALDLTEEINVIVETDDDLMRRLPWHRCDFFRDYPKAEIALSQPEYKRHSNSDSQPKRDLVRILAILGDSEGIDLGAETEFLQSLNECEVILLHTPTRQQLNTYLWDNLGWDIIFFAGHSRTEGATGRLYINNINNGVDNSITIEELSEALKAAIDKGLKLAIFNSCDGLGMALALLKLHIPTAIVMREPVPNRVAQVFFHNFLTAFAISHLPLYMAFQTARRQLQGLENEFPGASWLPIICQNPAVEPPTWTKI